MNAPPGAARIGPNAITQLAFAVEDRLGGEATRRLFAGAGLDAYLDDPPHGMVEEGEVIALHSTLRASVAPDAAQAIARAAGLATARYLLENRIPRAARRVLRALPAALASRALLAAIARHAWTFAGSARFSAVPGHPVRVALEDCPICRGERSAVPLCDYYGATFEGLFAHLVHPAARARETACCACGAPECVFEISWRS